MSDCTNETTIPPMPTAPHAPAQGSKSAAVYKLLSRTKGATSQELIAATGWQPHSMRAFLSGVRKRGGTLVREERKDGEQAYRLATVRSRTASDA